MKIRKVLAIGAVGAGLLAVMVACDPTPVSPITSYSGADIPVAQGGGPNVGLSKVKIQFSCTKDQQVGFEAQIFGLSNGQQVAVEQTLPGVSDTVTCTGSLQTETLTTVDPTNGGLYKAGATSANVSVLEMSPSGNQTFPSKKPVAVVLNAHYPVS